MKPTFCNALVQATIASILSPFLSSALADYYPSSPDVEIAVEFAPRTEARSWSDALTVIPGSTFAMRIQYNNSAEHAFDSTSILSQLPHGFSIVPGTTRNCITPARGEKICNTDDGQTGPIEDSEVWSGGCLTISPTAGLFGQQSDAIEGVLEMGKKRYLNYLNCDYALMSGANTDDIFGFAPANETVSSLACGKGVAGTYLREQHSSFSPLEIAGTRYLNAQNCDYQLLSNGNTDDLLSFSPGNTTAKLSCAVPSSAAVVLRGGQSKLDAVDHFGKRYLNFVNCDYQLTRGVNTDDLVGFLPDESPLTENPCGYGNEHFYLRTAHSKVLPLDLLDTSRGRGYIEVELKAPRYIAAYPFAVLLSNSELQVAGFGMVTVDRRRGPACRTCAR